MLKTKNKIETFVLLNINNSKPAFIDEKFVHKICEKLLISFQKSIKIKFIPKYDEKTIFAITHAIYIIIIVNEHRKTKWSRRKEKGCEIPHLA